MRNIPEKESLTVAFISDENNIEDVLVETAVALANTKGGEIYLSVDINGQILGLTHRNMSELVIIPILSYNVIPSISYRLETIQVEHKEIMRIEIYMSRSIVSTIDGKVLKRSLQFAGTYQNVPMYPYEFPSRLQYLELLDLFSQIIKDATLNDFDTYERKRLRHIIKCYGDLRLLDFSDEELDKALGFVKEDNGILYPTVTGMLLIGKEEKLQQLIPSAKTTFQIIRNNQIIINKTITKSIIATYEIIKDSYKINDVLKEGLLNAFVRRDYTILEDIHILIEDEITTITSPGGFVYDINLDNILTTDPHGRNQTLDSALKIIGLTTKQRGIDIIYNNSTCYELELNRVRLCIF